MANIVLIEDDDLLRPALVQTLARAGHTVFPSSNGIEGLRLVRSNRPELVITDLIMPGKEGLETIMELRRDPACPAIIAISGAGPASTYLSLASKMGARRTLMKPFSGDTLIAAVTEVLGSSSNRPSVQKNTVPSNPAAAPRSFKFVLIDDDPNQRFLNRRSLQRRFPGCSVVECSSPAEALPKCMGCGVDAILSDHHLAQADGLTFVETLRHRGLVCPILMVTVNADPKVRERAYESGVTRLFCPEDGDFAKSLHDLLVSP